jgi:hypothetical protein
MTGDPPALMRAIHDFMSRTKTFEKSHDASFTLMVDPNYVAPPGPLDQPLGDSIRPLLTPTPPSTPRRLGQPWPAGRIFMG